MRPTEKLVIDALAAHYSASWTLGEDPPDAYFLIGSDKVAVEISTLTQIVTDERGSRARLSDDIPAINFANELDVNLGAIIPEGRTVMLVLSSPIRERRKTQDDVASEIRDLVQHSSGNEKIERKIVVRKNKIEIYFDDYAASGDKKIFAAVMNRNSNPNILQNASHMLADRVAAKQAKCARMGWNGRTWLALYNDYFLADIYTYRLAYDRLNPTHTFGKILMVSDNKQVDAIFE